MPSHFLIVGAGTAGLASATFLARAGHHVTVFETVPELAPVGAGLLIQPSGQQVLQALGIVESLSQLGSRIDALHGYNLSKRRVLDLDYRHLLDDVRGLGIHRAHLAEALYQSALDAGVSFRFGQPVQQLDQTEHDVGIQLSSGETLRADALILANGTRSSLRQQLPIPHRAAIYPWGALWAICQSDDWHATNILEQAYDGPRRMLGALPSGVHPVTGTPCYSLFWSLPRAAYADWQQQPFSHWLDEVQRYWPAVQPLLTNLQREHVAWAEYSDVVMSRWHHGRVLCIGDAAHAMSPQLGQGANLALIDAYCLASSVGNAATLPQAFALYSKRRKAQLAYYQRASRWLTPLYQSQLPVGFLRDLGTRITRRVPLLYQQALDTLAGYKAGLLARHQIDDASDHAHAEN